VVRIGSCASWRSAVAAAALAGLLSGGLAPPAGAAAPATDPLPARARAARDRALARLVEERTADGHWNEITDLNVVCAATYVVMLRTGGLIANADAARREALLVRHMVRQANADGGFYKYVGSPSSVVVTRLAVTALRLADGRVHPAGRPPAWFQPSPGLGAPLREEIGRTLDRAEGFLKDGRWPGGTEFELDHFWLARVLEPLADPVSGRPLPPVLPPEFVAGIQRTPPLRAAAHPLSLNMRRAAAPMVLLAAASRAPGFEPFTSTALRRRAVTDLVERIRETQNPSGGWFHIPVYTMLSLAALRQVGVPADDPCVRRGMAHLAAQMAPSGDGGLVFDAFASEVWDTCQGLRALGASGGSLPPEQLAAAVEFVLDAQTPDGRFSYGAGDLLDADNDTTGTALTALTGVCRALDAPHRERVARAVTRGVASLRPYQERHGGFPAWDRGGLHPLPGSMSVANQFALDTPSADVAARVLSGLSRAGVPPGDPAVRAAWRFLADTQDAHGRWWCRWSAGYVPGTAWSLIALGQSGIDGRLAGRGGDPNAARAGRAARRGQDFLLRCQHADGSWGETLRADRDSRLAGSGPSSPSLTALAVCALLEVGQNPEAPAVRRGVEYLVGRQETDGRWSDPEPHCTAIARSSYYPYSLDARCLPIVALAQYLEALERGPRQAAGPDSSGKESVSVPDRTAWRTAPHP
jgi:squalene-hopene/tetraprenyl-beta-curcumene cyclase